jgi:hypothetical protein
LKRLGTTVGAQASIDALGLQMVGKSFRTRL